MNHSTCHVHCSRGTHGEEQRRGARAECGTRGSHLQRPLRKTNGRRRRRQLNVSAPAAVKLQAIRLSREKSLFNGLLTIGIPFGGAGQNLLGNQSGILPDRRLDFRGHFGIGLEKSFRILAALPEPLTVI